MQRVKNQPTWLARRAERLRVRRGSARVVRWIAYASGAEGAEAPTDGATAAIPDGKARVPEAGDADASGNVVRLRPRAARGPAEPV
ncbi:hypothetical protein J2X36_004989 [Methylobacterium sp. BE186]|uniref:hypothetical protein n=1 Tax=Methylobacterium sp. BE186 TaxID=2817715 RepID=UPI0028634250|nr:hypothetical protein [Methylobacterium sp. BE186]MDR7040208.1 hypothetical protein [Methylobacterium sp. BE186]